MQIEEITCWQVGTQVFDTKEEAEKYLRRAKVIELLENSDIYWRECSADEIVDTLIKNKDKVIEYLSSM